MEILHAVVYWSIVGCLVYLTSVYAAFVLLLVPSAREAFHLSRQARHEDYDAIADSTFTIPVSIIAPAFNEEVLIVAAVRSLLRLEYPHYEVIVVNDGSSDGTLRILQEAFDLQPRESFVRRVFSTRPIRGAYVSRVDPRLTVIDKENGGKSDGLNAGLNFARFRYICTVDSDTVFHPHALLRAMRLVLRDPQRIVGVTSHVAISRRPEEGNLGRAGTERIDEGTLTNYQHLDYLRAFLINRLGWSRLDFMLCSVGAFAIWRRDLVVELGGFSGAFTCEDIEFTFRVHEHFRRRKEPYRVLALAEAAGRTEGPDTIARLVSQRARWQRVITETVWHYRRMFLNPRYGSVGLLGMPYYTLVEVLAPVFQVISVIVVPTAWWIGDVPLVDLLLFLLAIGFANGVLTNVALYLHDANSRSYPLQDLIRLILLGPLDLVLYRPILFFAQAKGLIDFLRGDKAWHKFARNDRATRRAAA
jgi:cellulose synthase/poly-beta-1,6-N-acetylglucosamine synthase-like glycosyltransferase